MIISNREHCLDYLGIHENLDKALRYISETDFGSLPDGAYSISGQDVTVKVQHITGKPPEEAKLEAHDKFADIQMVLEGSEMLFLCFRDGTARTQSFPERDVSFYEGPSQPVTLSPGQFAVVFPDDVHAPGIRSGGLPHIRKCVFKVRLADQGPPERKMI